MSKEYTTIRVTQDAKDDAEESKRDSETWNDYLRRCTDNPPETREYVKADALVGAVVSDLRAQLPAEVADEVEERLR